MAGILAWSCHTFAGSLDNWSWRNPLPNGNPPAILNTLYGVVFANGKFVAVGGAGMACISTDTTNWPEASTATTNSLAAITCGNGEYVAVGASGTVETSPDGTNWVLQNSGTASALSAVAYANGHFVAVGPSVVITSANGVTWSSSVSGLSGGTGVAGGSTGFVAVSQFSAAYYSPDGTTWTSQPLAAQQYPVVTYANGLYMIASESYPSSWIHAQYVTTSPDGQNWTPHSIGNIFSTEYPEYEFICYGNGNVITWQEGPDFVFQISSDLTNWTTTNSLPSDYTAGFYGREVIPPPLYAGVYGNGKYVVFGEANTFTPYSDYNEPPIFTSSDAMTWSNQRPTCLVPPTGPTGTFTGIASTNGVYVVCSGSSIVRSADDVTYTSVSGSPVLSAVVSWGGSFAGVGQAGAIYQSSDGNTWTQRNSATAQNLHAVAGGGLLVAVGDSGTIQTAATGTVWTSRTSGTSLALYGVTASTGLYVTVGQEGTVLSSPDGINWSGQYSGQLNDLNSVACGSAGFVAVGTGGTIVSSPDGTNWSPSASGTTNALESVTFGNGYYLAVAGAVVLTSPDGQTWSSRSVGLTGGQNLFACAFLNGRFDVVGSGGTILESGVVAPLVDLQIHRGCGACLFTVFSPAGNSYRIQSTANLGVPNWTDVATNLNPAAISQWTNSGVGAGSVFYRVISP